MDEEKFKQAIRKALIKEIRDNAKNSSRDHMLKEQYYGSSRVVADKSKMPTSFKANIIDEPEKIQKKKFV